MSSTFLTTMHSDGDNPSVLRRAVSSEISSATTSASLASVINRAAAASDIADPSAKPAYTVATKIELDSAVAKIAADSSDATMNGGAARSLHYVTDGEQIYTTSGGQLGHFAQYMTDTNSAFAHYHKSPPDVAAYESSTGYSTGLNVNNQQATRILQANQLAGYGAIHGQLVSHQGQTYILQTGNEAVENDGLPLHHMTRASPVTVEWLLENFEPYEGVSLARCTLYSHYLRHCLDHALDAMNAASFGKLIRSIFVGLKTRRLGARGNSKYHYYGIRVKPTSRLNQYSDNVVNTARTGSGVIIARDIGDAKRNAPTKRGNVIEADDLETVREEAQDNPTEDPDGSERAKIQEHLRYLGTPSFNAADLNGILSEGFLAAQNQITLPEGISFEDLFSFENLYRDHCESILEVVANLQFDLLESLWSSFWKRDEAGVNCGDDDELEAQLPKRKLLALCGMDLVRSYIRQCDQVFYQSLVEVLMPDVLRPIPLALTQVIRNFAKNLESWARGAMENLPPEARAVKMATVHAFSQILRRYTSLNHLAQAARAVLQNTTQIAQMVEDLNRVDFKSIQEQASWVCNCEHASIESLERDFKQTLDKQSSLQDWASWLESVIDQVLSPHTDSPSFSKAARQFLLKWSFYTSMVIRDLTLRSAASFGSFHLIRLLFDEYMYYVVERRVATALGVSSVGVMETFKGGSVTGLEWKATLRGSEPAVPEAAKRMKASGAENDESVTSTSSIDASEMAWDSVIVQSETTITQL